MVTGHPISADEGQVHLWVVDLDRLSRSGLGPATITPGDRTQADRLRERQTADRLLARRSATRSIIARTLGLDPGAVAISRLCPTCGSDAHGRPLVPGSPLAFSVTSSHGVATVATSDRPIGVDLETDRPALEVSPLALTSGEQRVLDQQSEDTRATAYLRLWTAKEAVLKSCGRSLADGMAGVDAASVLGGGQSPVRCGDDQRTVRHWRLAIGGNDECILALAEETTGPVIWHGVPASPDLVARAL
jgi:4'-phosphopantetheinyl transferase